MDSGVINIILIRRRERKKNGEKNPEHEINNKKKETRILFVHHLRPDLKNDEKFNFFD